MATQLQSYLQTLELDGKSANMLNYYGEVPVHIKGVSRQTGLRVNALGVNLLSTPRSYTQSDVFKIDVLSKAPPQINCDETDAADDSSDVHGHRFDWRWDVLESCARQLDDR